jgi:peptide/nickel transport system substrate-binding protein
VMIALKRNPVYWKRDSSGAPLPRVDSIRIDIQQNRDLELLRFQKGELHLIDKLTPDLYERIVAQAPASVVDAGPTLESEFLWFNMAARAPMPDFKRSWFRSTAFRRAISRAINRPDLCMSFITGMPARLRVRCHLPTKPGLEPPVRRNSILRPL